jgi:nitrogen fixation/metabolism regulation signal transduction histidine kinase
MFTHWLYLLLGFLLVVTVFYAVGSLRGGSRLQRRLFLLFLCLAFVPSTAMMYVNWRINHHNLAFLDSAGLRDSLESSLHLARSALDLQRERATAMADSMSQKMTETSTITDFSDGPLIFSASSAGQSRRFGSMATEFYTYVDSMLVVKSTAEEVPAPLRVVWRNQPFIVATTAELWLAMPLPQTLLTDLDNVVQGSSRVRQMRLYYGSLLRNNTLVILTLLGIVLLISSLLLSRYFARRIGAPLIELTRGTELVAAGNLEHRVTVSAVDELGDLVAAFNQMTVELARSENERRRAERIAAWQGIARRLAHEIKNPLTPIGLSMHRIRGKVDDPVVIECVDAVLEETENLKRLADEFSLYARLPAPRKEMIQVSDLIKAVTSLYAERTHLTIRYENWDDDLSLQVDPGQIRQVFANLVKNAVEAMGSRGELTLELERGNRRVRFHVNDSGPGLDCPPDELFEPYYTTKDAGTGLGLAIARKIAIDHGGDLIASASAGGGAKFTVILPLPENDC